MKTVNYYRAEKVSNTITAIKSLTGEIMYLIEGKEKAILIDTCLGVGNLRAFVESLTQKPLVVILTHGHVDHAMGAPEFEQVYMNHKDCALFTKHSPLEIRQQYIKMSLPEENWSVEQLDYVPAVPVVFLELNDGDIFDLGGLHLEVYALPGHTKGVMVILIREERILITGDACNVATFLFDEDAVCVEDYRNNLVELEKRLTGRYDKVFLAHHEMLASKELIKNVIAVCDDIMDGRVDDIPFLFMGQTHYIAKAVNEGFVRKDGGEGNIIYNKSRVRNKN